MLINLRHKFLFKRNNNKGQTALEYAMVIAVVILPIALAIREAIRDSEDQQKKSLVNTIVSDAYGDEKRLGIIGRPYP